MRPVPVPELLVNQLAVPDWTSLGSFFPLRSVGVFQVAQLAAAPVAVLLAY